MHTRKTRVSKLTVSTGLALFALTSFAQTAVIAQDEPAAPAAKPARKFNKEAIGHYNRARALYEQGFLNKAIEAYKAAIVADERMDQAYCNLGLIYIQQKNFAKAQEYFKKALALKPTSAYSLNGMASVLFYRGEKEQAIEKWQEAVKADPRFAFAYMNMGNALESLSRKPEALNSYVKSFTLQPDMAVSYYHAGLLLMDLNHEAQAAALLAKAVMMEPESEWARDGRKRIETLRGRFNKEQPDSPEIAEMKVIGAGGEIIREEKLEPDSGKSGKKKDAKKEVKKADAAPEGEKKGGMMSRFKKKEKPATEMKMYTRDSTSSEQPVDLQGRPDVAN